jgi:NADH-quinone oxidoreductase subunit N
MSSTLAAVFPEFVLTVTVAVLLVADAALRHHPWRSRAVGLVAAVGIGLALGGLGSGEPNHALFSGMLAADGFARFFRGLFLVAALFGVALGALSDEIPTARFGEYLVLLVCLTLGMNLLGSAQNLLMIYLALELVSLPSYVLAGFRRADRQSSEAALKYVIYGGAASGLMLYGFSLLYGLSGTLDLAGIGDFFVRMGDQSPATRTATSLAALLSLVGFGFKIASAPFHMWCPDVYQGAPTPFVAFLSVGPKAAGFAALVRFVVVGFGATGASLGLDGFPWPTVLAVLSVLTMTLGNLVAIVQDNVKRMLAYSSIAQAGYILMGVAAGSERATRAVMLYLGVYLAMNLGAFLAVMAVRARAGRESISEYRGLGSADPFLAATLAVFLFSLTGLPPLGGFIAKFYLFAAVLGTGLPLFYVVVLIGVLNSAVSLYYYARVVKAMYLESAEADAPSAPRSSPGYRLLLGTLVIPTVLLGIWWAPLSDTIDGLSTLLR